MEFCNTNQTEYKCSELGSHLAVGVNIASIIVNIIHLIAILNIKALSGKVYKKILVTQTLQDILIGIGHCLALSCDINKLISNISDSKNIQLAVILAKNIYFEGITMSRYSFFCVILTDRYLAFCKPFQYTGHIAVRHFNKLILMSFVVPIIYKMIFAIVYADSICIDNLVGPTHMNDGSTISAFMDFAIPMILPLIVAMVFVINITREFCRSASHQSCSHRRGPQEDRADMRRATIYVVVSFLAYLILLIPGTPGFVLWYEPDIPELTRLVYAYASFISYAVYGMLNVFMFVVMHKKYYHKVCMNLFHCNPRLSGSIQPQLEHPK